MNILILCDYFVPGTQAGGPIQSLSAIVEELAKTHDVTVLTRNRDFGSSKPYADIVPGRRVNWKGAAVVYLDRKRLLPSWLRMFLVSIEYDVVYLNSFFSSAFTVSYLCLRRTGLVPARPVVLAPRGEFSPSALGIKRTRKRIYNAMSRRIGLLQGIVWHVSSDREANDIKKFMRNSYRAGVDDSRVFVLPPLKNNVANNFVDPGKQKGFLRIVFVSRIARMKNLVGALNALSTVKGNVVFDIYGPREDTGYWGECDSICRLMPDNCQVTYKGELAPVDVIPVIQQYDLFFLPTLGENFGHVILEALISGRPVLISDRTRWNNISVNSAGWVASIDEIDSFARIIEKCVDMSESEFSEYARNAWQHGQRYLSDNAERLEEYNRMFKEVAGTEG